MLPRHFVEAEHLLPIGAEEQLSLQLRLVQGGGYHIALYRHVLGDTEALQQLYSDKKEVVVVDIKR